MRISFLLILFIFFSCESPIDNGDGGGSSDVDGDGGGTSGLQALTDEQLNIPFSSCYGSDLDDRDYTLNDSSFDGKAIVIHYMTPW